MPMQGIHTTTSSKPFSRRSKTFCGQNVAHDFYGGVILLVVILLIAVVYIFGVFWSADCLDYFDSDNLNFLFANFCFLLLCSETCLFLIVFADPGLTPPDAISNRDHFCPVCRVHVREYDHHCGVLGACIGKGNLRYFISFFFFTVLLTFEVFAVTSIILVQLLRQAEVNKLIAGKEYRQLTTVLKNIFLTRVQRVLLIPIVFIAAHSNIVTLFFFSFYTVKTCRGNFSVERRRSDKITGCAALRYVFAGLFRPQLTNAVFNRAKSGTTGSNVTSGEGIKTIEVV